MLVISRFDAPSEDFLERAQAALDAFAARPGFVRGRIGRAADDPDVWVLTTEWDGVGAYRRSLSAFEVKVHAAPLLAEGRDEPGAFEVLRAVDGGTASSAVSERARDAHVAGPGSAAGPAPVDVPGVEPGPAGGR